MNPALIELHIPDFTPAREFYGKLGFETSWERPPEGMKGYLVLTLEENVICFWGGNENIYANKYFQRFEKDTPKVYGLEIVLQISDLHTFYEQAKRNFEILEPLQMRPWGLEDFRLIDPFGFYLRVTSKHEIRDSKYAIK